MAFQQGARCSRLGRETKSALRARAGARHFAVVGTTTFVGKPPLPPAPGPSSTPSPSPSLPPSFDTHVLSELRRHAAKGQTPLPELIEQYVDRGGLVLDSPLPYESCPTPDRRVAFGADSADGSVAMVVHVAEDRGEHAVTYCSGFALSAPGLADGQSKSVFVTCAHTLEEIRFSPLVRSLTSASPPPPSGPSGSFVVTGPASAPAFTPVASIVSSLHRADLLLLATGARPASRTLPVSPYPAHPGTRVRAHFVTHRPPAAGPDVEGWRPWVGGAWSKWVGGSIVGYRDLAGREAKPGTYDALSHMLFEPPPTLGSSGGPVVDEESGAVVGVMLGTQMRNRLEGVSGWGVPSELIFEMFSLPGLNLKNRA